MTAGNPRFPMFLYIYPQTFQLVKSSIATRVCGSMARADNARWQTPKVDTVKLKKKNTENAKKRFQWYSPCLICS